MMETLKGLKSKDYWQKFCAAEDWFCPDFDFVVKQILNRPKTFRRKQWEYATIFLNLYHAGMLSPDKQGAAFGAGREGLLFIIAPMVEKFYATDLYNMNTVWATANTGKDNDPREFVFQQAPENFPSQKLDVLDMDMRDLSHFDDNSLDFCYSMCAFEHIGHRKDFISHLKEVARVLKPGGIYSMTTEFLFNCETKPILGNYKFDLEYLRELFVEAGLDTKETFDGRCDNNLINWPKPPVDSFQNSDLTNNIPTPFLYLEGVPYSTCNFVLSPSKKAETSSFKATGMVATARMLTHRSNINILKSFSSWQSLDPFKRLRREVREYMDDHKEYIRSEGFVIDVKKNLVHGLMFYTDFIHFNEYETEFRVSYSLSGYEKPIKWSLVEKDQMRVEGRKALKKHKTLNHERGEFSIVFTPKKDKVYALSAEIKASIQNSALTINDIQIDVRIKKH